MQHRPIPFEYRKSDCWRTPNNCAPVALGILLHTSASAALTMLREADPVVCTQSRGPGSGTSGIAVRRVLEQHGWIRYYPKLPRIRLTGKLLADYRLTAHVTVAGSRGAHAVALVAGVAVGECAPEFWPSKNVSGISFPPDNDTQNTRFLNTYAHRLA